MQSVRKLDGGELALRVYEPRVLLTPYLGIGDPVVFDGRVEVVLHGGCDPDNSAGVRGSSGGDEERVEKPDEEEVTEDVCAELEVEFLSSELIDWWDHHSSVCNQHVQFGLLPMIRKSVRQWHDAWRLGDILEELLGGFLGGVQIAQVEFMEDGFLAGLFFELV